MGATICEADYTIFTSDRITIKNWSCNTQSFDSEASKKIRQLLPTFTVTERSAALLILAKNEQFIELSLLQ